MSRKAHIYLDSETDSLLDQLAERDRQRLGFASRSEVVRRAVRDLASAELGERSQERPRRAGKKHAAQ